MFGAGETSCSSDTMAEVILPVNLAVMIAKTFFVVDAIRGIRGHKSVVCRAARAANSSGLLGSQRSSSSQGRRSAPNRPPVLAQRGRSASASAGSPKVRFLHIALLLEHIVALIAIASTVLKYALPVTASNCNATHKVSTAFAILFDASLLTFLLFKVDVTNGIRKLSCWEKGVIWICRAFAWIYLPLASIFVSATYPGGTNEEGTFCENGFKRDEDVNYEREASDNAYGYAVTNAMLLVQYVLLLILFVRPLMVRLEGAQSGGAVYRSVVIRNISCTVAVVVSYIITTIVTVIALLRQHPNDTAVCVYVVRYGIPCVVAFFFVGSV
ncbi:hypothetical protein Esi_0158_0063 [Ectocarpus siliculosus]|uniref:Uncharacterized protein n=1 Tax=Ectocarpus siliculosus TaxID=2880 RepID=D8LG97_ECTSI|nr:hypothetical protein Esi_0158_0063 [Ectocarpus siliculosus]|eukprot:CBN78996.1 hypothetical protein Esi_0158_0063 [Ectocarpus siliculosus]